MRTPPIRLFENRFLERMTHVRPQTVALLWSGVIGGLWGWAAGAPGFRLLPSLWLTGAGWLAWSLFEYSLHRWLFHWQPDHPALKRMVFMIHGVHHLQPDDPTRVVMPPLASAPLALALWGLAWLALPAPAAHVFFAGFLLGYLHYDITHWACHQVRFKLPLGRLVRRHHLLHHHVAPDRNFGVATPVWDHAFGTVLERPDLKS